MIHMGIDFSLPSSRHAVSSPPGGEELLLVMASQNIPSMSVRKETLGPKSLVPAWFSLRMRTSYQVLGFTLLLIVTDEAGEAEIPPFVTTGSTADGTLILIPDCQEVADRSFTWTSEETRGAFPVYTAGLQEIETDRGSIEVTCTSVTGSGLSVEKRDHRREVGRSECTRLQGRNERTRSRRRRKAPGQ